MLVCSMQHKNLNFYLAISISYQVIAILFLFMRMILYYLWRTISKLDGLVLDDVLAHGT